MQRFSEHQLHGYLGFRNLKNWLDLKTAGKETIKVTKGTDRPLELGDVANIRHSRRNTKPVPRPAEYLRTVHMDIRYGDCVSIGGVPLRPSTLCLDHTISMGLRFKVHDSRSYHPSPGTFLLQCRRIT
jgi:hypothetical protein